MADQGARRNADSQGSSSIQPLHFHAAALIARGASRGVIAKELGIHPVTVSRIKQRPEVQALVQALLVRIGQRVIEEEALRIHRAAGTPSKYSSAARKLDVTRVLKDAPSILDAWRKKPAPPRQSNQGGQLSAQRSTAAAMNAGTDKLEEE